MAPRHDFLPDLYHYHSDREKILIPLRQCSFENVFSPLAEREGEGQNYESYIKLTIGPTIGSVNTSNIYTEFMFYFFFISLGLFCKYIQIINLFQLIHKT